MKRFLGASCRTTDEAIVSPRRSVLWLVRREAAIREGLPLWSSEPSWRTGSAKECVVRVGIWVLARTRRNVLLRTRDVRQIRRTVLGMRKAPGMESNKAKYIQTAEH